MIAKAFADCLPARAVLAGVLACTLRAATTNIKVD
jgi:hypothetical protein